MSLKDKAKKIDFGALPSASPEMVESSLPRPKTAPGMMMSRAADQRSDITRENNELKDKVAELETAAARAAELQDELAAWGDAKATRLLDPKTVTWSKWANRDEANFSTQEFAEFKDEIASAGATSSPSRFDRSSLTARCSTRSCLDTGGTARALSRAYLCLPSWTTSTRLSSLFRWIARTAAARI